MLKLTKEGLLYCLKSCINASANSQTICQRFRPSTCTATVKCFSQGHTRLKEFSIKNPTEFDEKVMQNDHPVLVDFHANWCDPCTKLTPRMSALLKNSEEVDLAIIDVETNTDLVDTFNVQSVPTVFAVQNGKIVHKFIGLVEANILKSMIDSLKAKDSTDGGVHSSTA
ncbi:thioredoxin-like [Haematobia irritans]|uniref:thioredoxin-like n=1 Tax=Haematobia irritans TaxID=7368 RepID=UPI003F4FF8D3